KCAGSERFERKKKVHASARNFRDDRLTQSLSHIVRAFESVARTSPAWTRVRIHQRGRAEGSDPLRDRGMTANWKMSALPTPMLTPISLVELSSISRATAHLASQDELQKTFHTSNLEQR